MGDDLSAFFAKKAQKSKEKKKKGIIKIDDVGNQLERKVRKQEQEDLEEQEREQLELADDRFLRSQENEDSEWLEFTDTKNRLADVRVRDMDYTEQTEEEIAEEKAASEHIKTWKIESKDDKDGNDENLIKPVVQKQPAVYRPPTLRTVQKKAQLDLTNDEMFPSLANADKIAKELEEKKKQEEEQRKKNPVAYQKEENFVDAPASQRYTPRERGDRDQNSERPRYQPPGDRDRDGFTEVRQKREPPPTSRADEADTWRRASGPAVQKPAEPQREAPREEVKPAAPKPGSYVPPHMRNRQT